MKIITLIVKELVGLFVDDEFLAVAILCVVFIAAAFAYWVPGAHLLVGAIIFLGCLGALTLSLSRAARK